MKEPLQKRGTILYFSHGGGPLPILGDPSHQKMVDFMKDLPRQIHEPEVMVVFSAHWEEAPLHVQSGGQPPLVYDYYGFPKESYDLEYPCKGRPALAEKIVGLLEENGIQAIADPARPYDHGSYIPLTLMYPDAHIPVLQISLHHSLDPLMHLNLGRALRPLMDESILFIGSGFSFHNTGAFDIAGLEKEDEQNNAFQDAITRLCCEKVEEAEKWERWTHWTKLPYARYCHPREEHLLPLLVCAGMASEPATKIFDDYILGKRATGFFWQE
ncbi:dioxygenase [Alkalibacter rhizosphaerae]|uniref:Dioxygenase n=1 Tax=Alkalibacter rhizosphaerae TaxID=2815577 RepID=A0A974XGD6_9FIRM|nr:class III extradiol ring-cleavage dioxygenase [Alkalibacter rhizosphaerae]QSX08235.1 dioxygenase [Alkalibacter rhizosphaerae]